MKTLHAVIEWAGQNYSAYVEEVSGVCGIGCSLDEVKKSMEDGMNILKEDCQEKGYEVPDELLDDYRVVYRMDTKTFLQMYCRVFSKAGLEYITGINQKQLWHYANGKTKPRPAQVKKIERALHQLGEELLSLEL